MDEEKASSEAPNRPVARRKDRKRAEPEVKRKDAWDKAAIIVSATSSVVIALAALMINSSIQRSQVENATRAAEAQIKSQNLKTTTDLIQYLESGEPLKQEIALVALRGAVENNDDVIVDIVRIVASTTQDVTVKNEAVETLKQSKSSRVAKILSAIYSSQSTPESIKDSAYIASQAVALRSTLGAGTAILYAAQPGQLAFEDNALNSGVFTYFLLKTLAEDPDAVQGNQIVLDELFNNVSRQVEDFTASKYNQHVAPMLEVTGARKVPMAKATVLAIGISKYANRDAPALRFAATDARSFADAFRKRYSAKTVLLADSAARRDAVLAALDDAAANIGDSQTFVLYFSGHGWNIDGQQYLAAEDANVDRRVTSSPSVPDVLTRGLFLNIPKTTPNNVISFKEIQTKLSRIKAAYKLLIIDTCANDPFPSR